MRKLNVMSRPTKPTVQAKRVAPPTVPDVYRHSGSSFGSAGYGSSEDNGGFMTQPDTPNALGVRTFAYSVPREPLTHKAAVFYHQQLALQEDQGIDLTQSPGRDSPGSSSGSAGSSARYSRTSLDSGRASAYNPQSSLLSVGPPVSSVRNSSTGIISNVNLLANRVGSLAISGGGGGCGGSNSSGCGSLTSPRCSVSSSSIGSVDRISQRSVDHDIISDWLRELCFEEYANLFSAAGYDMPTICRMTPEDLTAIGIKKPHHRERIKQHIDELQMPDNLPHYVPGSIEEWLRLLRLDEYVPALLAQGYAAVRDVTQLPWEDMEDIGIVKLGHQKKLLLAIKRVKDIVSGKWAGPPPPIGGPIIGSNMHAATYMVAPILHTSWSQQQQQQQQQQQSDVDDIEEFHQPLFQSRPFPSTSYQSQPQTQSLGNWEQQQQQQQQLQSGFLDSTDDTTNDIVLIKLRQHHGHSLESLEIEPADRMSTSLTSSATNPAQQPSHLTFSRTHGAEHTSVYYRRNPSSAAASNCSSPVPNGSYLPHLNIDMPSDTLAMPDYMPRLE